MEYDFRKATLDDLPQIWAILQDAIKRRKADGSNQWQDGYPNPEVVKEDIRKGIGFVLVAGSKVTGYCAVLINDEPAYANIEGKWLSDKDFVVIHRVAIAEDHLGMGLTRHMLTRIEEFALSNGITSIKADTNYDNPAMIHIFEKQGYMYCGQVYLRGAPRRAYEKLLTVPT